MKSKMNLIFFYSRKLKSMLHLFIVFEFGFRTGAYEFFVELQSWPIRVKMCDILRAVKICKLVGWRHKVCKAIKPSSHLRGISEGVGRFRYQRACFSELQNTTYAEGTVFCLYFRRAQYFRRAHCWRFVRIHRPNCKARKASVLSLHFEQSSIYSF